MEMITIIICTFNRNERLREAMKSLLNQTRKDFWVIVVDNNSSDNTAEVAQSFNGRLHVRYFRETAQGLSFARNTGILEAKTPYVGFLDDDARASENWIEAAAEIIRTDRPVIFGGPIYPFYECSKPAWFLDKYETRAPAERECVLRKGKILSGSNIFFSKEIFEKIGLFDENLGMKKGKLGLGEESKLQRVAHEQEIPIRYYTRLIVKHLVPKHKMRVSYMFARSFSFGLSARVIYGDNNGFMTEFFRLLKAMARFFFSIAKMIFRKKFGTMYWQNDFLKVLLPVAEHLGIVLSYVK